LQISLASKIFPRFQGISLTNRKEKGLGQTMAVIIEGTWAEGTMQKKNTEKARLVSLIHSPQKTAVGSLSLKDNADPALA
jgi:hypothetical protein